MRNLFAWTTTIAFLVLPTTCVAFVPSSSSRRRIIVARPRRAAPSWKTTTTCARLARADNDDDNNDEQLSSPDASWLWKVCLPLWLVYISNQWSRSSLYYLVDFSAAATTYNAMNVDIGFDEVQYGLLASVAFTSLFAVASLGAGIAADRSNRKLLTLVSAAGWSAAVFGTATAESFETVLACRIAMGLACAVSTPTAYTLIRDRVSSNRVATASAIYGTGVALAGGLSSLTILLDTAAGWRSALDVVGVFGLASATLTAVLLDDDDDKSMEKNGSVDVVDTAKEEFESTSTSTTTADSTDTSADETALAQILEDVSQVVSTSRVRWIFVGSFLRFCSGLCIGVWSAPFYRQVFAENQSDYAVAQAVISAGLASLSGVLGGATADWLSSTAGDDDDPVGRRLWVPVVGSVLAAPAWYLATQYDVAFATAMTWLAVEYFVAECWFGPTISTLQSTVGPRVGGTAQGMFTLAGAIANLAPTAVGFWYGQQGAAPQLAEILQVAVCFGYLSSAVCFALAAQSAPTRQEEEESTTEKA